MATYLELFSIVSGGSAPELDNRLRVACVVAAEAIRTEDPGTANHTNRLLWAKAVFESPASTAQAMLWAILAANKDATVEQITGASDATLQARVDAAVNVFATS